MTEYEYDFEFEDDHSGQVMPASHKDDDEGMDEFYGISTTASHRPIPKSAVKSAGRPRPAVEEWKTPQIHDSNKSQQSTTLRLYGMGGSQTDLAGLESGVPKTGPNKRTARRSRPSLIPIAPTPTSGAAPAAGGAGPRIRPVPSNNVNFEEMDRLIHIIDEQKLKIQELMEERKTLKIITQRQEKAIQRMDKDQGDLPRMVRTLTEEVRGLKIERERTRDRLAAAERSSQTQLDENIRLQTLVNQMSATLRHKGLERSEKLAETVEKLKAVVEKKNEIISDLERTIKHSQGAKSGELREARARNFKLAAEVDLLREEKNALMQKLQDRERTISALSIYSHANIRRRQLTAQSEDSDADTRISRQSVTNRHASRPGRSVSVARSVSSATRGRSRSQSRSMTPPQRRGVSVQQRGGAKEGRSRSRRRIEEEPAGRAVPRGRMLSTVDDDEGGEKADEAGYSAEPEPQGGGIFLARNNTKAEEPGAKHVEQAQSPTAVNADVVKRHPDELTPLPQEARSPSPASVQAETQPSRPSVFSKPNLLPTSSDKPMSIHKPNFGLTSRPAASEAGIEGASPENEGSHKSASIQKPTVFGTAPGEPEMEVGSATGGEAAASRAQSPTEDPVQSEREESGPVREDEGLQIEESTTPVPEQSPVSTNSQPLTQALSPPPPQSSDPSLPTSEPAFPPPSKTPKGHKLDFLSSNPTTTGRLKNGRKPDFLPNTTSPGATETVTSEGYTPSLGSTTTRRRGNKSTAGSVSSLPGGSRARLDGSSKQNLSTSISRINAGGAKKGGKEVVVPPWGRGADGAGIGPDGEAERVGVAYDDDFEVGDLEVEVV
ncbi:Lebercilin [Borealophlyctis nickersoniae]|nr:Lebercilin [Borealophlyctis nickersoniae]